MHFLTALALFLGSAAAAPQAGGSGPSKVKINSVRLLGSGCPAGTADVQVDATGSLFEATFSVYEVATGPGTSPFNWRKNCKLTLNMEFDPGHQFSIFDTDMFGFAEIPRDVRGECTKIFSFTGNGEERVVHSISLLGKYSGNFNIHSHNGVCSWSPCGGTAILNMNSACNISPTSLPALIAVDHISGKLTVKFAVQWRTCRRA